MDRQNDTGSLRKRCCSNLIPFNRFSALTSSMKEKRVLCLAGLTKYLKHWGGLTVNVRYSSDCFNNRLAHCHEDSSFLTSGSADVFPAR